jgi:hypothetical protein
MQRRTSQTPKHPVQSEPLYRLLYPGTKHKTFTEESKVVEWWDTKMLHYVIDMQDLGTQLIDDTRAYKMVLLQ